MKYLRVPSLLVLVLLIVQSGFSQRRGFPERPERKKPARLEKFKKMRLIEILKLNEEDAVRFFAKQSAHEEKTRELMEKRNSTLDNIEEALINEQDDEAQYETQAEKILDIDQKIFAERQRYHGELRRFLTPVQFAKFLTFERNFDRQVRDAMKEMYKDKRRRRNH